MIRPNEVTIYDLTGSDARFVRQHGWYGILGTDRTINFGEPVYFGSLVLEVRRNQQWELLIDWNSNVETVDSADLMPVYRYLYQESSHQELPTDTSHQLCDAIRLPAAYISEQQLEELPIRATYQAFFLDPVARVRANLGPVYTPGPMREVIERLDHLQNVINGFAVDSECVHLIHGSLPLDLTGQADKNYIKNEPYYVDTRLGATVIIPRYGKFYGYNVRLVYQGETLQEQVDYELTGLDTARTKISEPASGVYTFIRVKRAMRTTEEDPLLLSYHAFGGTVTNRMYDDMALELSWLHSRLAFMLTQDNLIDQPAIIDLRQRLEGVERQLQLTRTQTYNYSCPGDGVHVWKTFAKYDLSRILPDQHWPLQQAIARFRISYGFLSPETTDNLVQQEFTVSFSRTTATGDLKFNTKILSSQAPSLEENGVSYFDQRIVTKLRLAWQPDTNDNAKIAAGPFLQFAILPSDAISEQYTNQQFTSQVQVEILTTSFVNDVWTLLEPNTSLDNNGQVTVIPGTETYSTDKLKLLYRSLNPGEAVLFHGALPLQATPRIPEILRKFERVNNDDDIPVRKHYNHYLPCDQTILSQLNPSQICGSTVTIFDRFSEYDINGGYCDIVSHGVRLGYYFDPLNRLCTLKLAGQLVLDQRDFSLLNWYIVLRTSDKHEYYTLKQYDQPEYLETLSYKKFYLSFKLGTASKRANRFVLCKFSLLLR